MENINEEMIRSNILYNLSGTGNFVSGSESDSDESDGGEFNGQERYNDGDDSKLNKYG